MTTVDVGDAVNIQYLALAAGVPTAATVAITITTPDGTPSTPTPVFTAPNQYDVTFVPSSAGPWSWRWNISGTVTDVARGSVLAVDVAPELYAPLDVLKTNLNIDQDDTSRDAVLLQKLDVASRSIETYCDGRRFYLEPTATARVFSTTERVVTADGYERVDVDDIGVDDITVEVGDGVTYVPLTGAESWPINALAKQCAIEGLVSTGWTGHRRIRVTARWGWPAVPAAVYEATLLQAMRLFKRPGSPEGAAGASEWGLVRVPRLDPDVRALVRHLRRSADPDDNESQAA